MFGYSNETNPFGDSNLLQPFTWKKKVDKDKAEGKEVEDSDEARLKLIRDIENVRKRRLDREKELEEMEQLRYEEQRLREAAQYGDWEQKEEDFHMQQTKVRSTLRILERRQEPIDFLAKNILLIENSRSDDKVPTSFCLYIFVIKEIPTTVHYLIYYYIYIYHRKYTISELT